MRKSEMAKMVSKLTGMTFAKSLETIDCIFESISMSVAQGHRVHFRNFGSFYPRKKAERIGRNPKTGVDVAITARTIPCFKASAILKRKVDV